MQHIPETPLDPLLARLYKTHGQRLELRPDAPAEISTPSGSVFEISIPAERLTEILAAVTPPRCWEELWERGYTAFDLDTREGIFRFSLSKTEHGIAAVICNGDAARSWPAGAAMPSDRPSPLTVISRTLLLIVGAMVLFVFFAPLLLPPHRMSKQSRSINNIKQLTLGVIMYAQDYDETFPGWVRTPGGRYAHNTWDEQIHSVIKSENVFFNDTAGIKSPSDPEKARILSYAFNGALLAPYDSQTGDVDWTATPIAGGTRPTLLGMGTVPDPAATILIAEVSADAPPPTVPAGAVGVQPQSGATVEEPSRAWLAAQPAGDSAATAVIDISPRTWVSGAGNTADDWYNEARTGFAVRARNGVARDLYSGGGTYGFVDGHVKFMRIQDTVGIGRMNHSTPVTSANWFKPENAYNMWNPAHRR